MALRAALLVAAFALIAADGPKTPPAAKEVERLKVPAKLMPRQGKVLFLLRAEGTQKYEGQLKDGKLQWVFQAPRAVLRDYDTGEKVGTHSKAAKGPVWEGTDRSKVEGKLIASERAPNGTAIPWLLLEATGDGKGRFGKVSFIARVDTWAGGPPTTPPARAGAVKEVHYQATYVFFGKPQ
jgi:Protein of unknown function (DUF3455)